MKERLKYFFAYYFFWVLVFLSQKPFFMLYQWHLSSSLTISEWFGVVWHGLPMDFSTAGYVSVLPLLILLASSFFSASEIVGRVLKCYTVLVLAVVCIVFVADMFLYPFWGFKLDITPLFYMQTPKDAAASASLGLYLCSFVILLANFAVYYFLFDWWHRRLCKFDSVARLTSVVVLLLVPVLFVVIRGGTTVSVMNAGRVYFSRNMFVNHSAINPVWNLLASFGKENDFASQYRFMNDAEAHALFDSMRDTVCLPADTMLLACQKPNVLMIIMESFGSNICEYAGGVKGCTPNLDKLASEGVFFSNFFSNSFRTDRGLVCILGAYPGQPVTSLMKYPVKSQNVPMLSQALRDNGYDLSFFYGGDENFTNMRSFLVTGGFHKRVCQDDFTSSELSTKWGAYDHVVFRRTLDELKADTVKKPFFDVVLTLNSHEPFDVPFNKFNDPYLNSVAYTDSCLGSFVDSLRRLPLWDSTLVVILPDHPKPYPQSMTNYEVARYRSPMVWTGGAIKSPMRVDVVCSQIDLTRTLLAQLGIDGSDFVFSKNVFSSKSPKFAFYAFNDGFGFVDQNLNSSVFDCGGDVSIAEDDSSLTRRGKAFLQCLFDDLANR